MELIDIQDVYARSMAPSLVCEIISGCSYTSILSAAINLGIEILSSGNRNCQNLFVWHLKTIEHTEAIKFFRAVECILLDTSNRYFYIRRCRESQDASVSAAIVEKLSVEDTIQLSDDLQTQYNSFSAVELLRLLNEGHNFEVQSFMEDQKVRFLFYSLVSC